MGLGTSLEAAPVRFSTSQAWTLLGRHLIDRYHRVVVSVETHRGRNSRRTYLPLHPSAERIATIFRRLLTIYPAPIRYETRPAQTNQNTAGRNSCGHVIPMLGQDFHFLVMY